MIEPEPCRCISGTAARDQSQVPPTLVRNTASQSAGSVVTTVPPQEKPAAVISTSRRPRRATISLVAVSAKSAALNVTDMHRCLRPSRLRIAAKRLLQAGVVAIDQRDETRLLVRTASRWRDRCRTPAPVTTAVRSHQSHVTALSMLRPPHAQIGGRIGAAKSRAPAELLRHALDRKRRAVGRHCADRPSALHLPRPIGK